MKRLVLALTVMAFAVAAQAGEGKTCSKDKAACATKDKAACATKSTAQGTCPSKMSACSKSGAQAQATCPKAQAAKKRSLMSPKAAGDVALN